MSYRLTVRLSDSLCQKVEALAGTAPSCFSLCSPTFPSCRMPVPRVQADTQGSADVSAAS
jgi:hypothetical protein